MTDTEKDKESNILIPQMRKAAGWRGSAKATKRPEFMRLMKILRPTRNDVFYDLGCGYANTCVWISKKVGSAVGVEDFGPRYRKAVENVTKSGSKNVKILKRDVSHVSLKSATIIYSLIELTIEDFRRIQRSASPGTKIALWGPPPYPIRSKKHGPYFTFRLPYKMVRSPDEYAKIYLGRKRATIEDLYDWVSRKEARSLKWYISRERWHWKKLGR